jgi:hypothetical protein
LNINLDSATILVDGHCVPGSQLDAEQITQLCKFQARDSEERRGLGLKSMASITVPAFMAATYCHLFSTMPLLSRQQATLTRNDSSDLFMSPILAAHEQMVGMGATALPLTHRQQQDTNMSLNLKAWLYQKLTSFSSLPYQLRIF